jgi:hypothetical protein
MAAPGISVGMNDLSLCQRTMYVEVTPVKMIYFGASRRKEANLFSLARRSLRITDHLSEPPPKKVEREQYLHEWLRRCEVAAQIYRRRKRHTEINDRCCICNSMSDCSQSRCVTPPQMHSKNIRKALNTQPSVAPKTHNENDDTR